MQNTNSKFHYAWFIFIGCCFMMAGGLGAVLDAGIGAFVQPVMADLHFGQAELMFYLSVYFLTTIIAMPLVGYILPRYNIRVVLTTAFALTVLAFGLCSVYTEVWMWYISGFIYGLAGSFIFVIPVPILIGNWFHKRRALMLGIAMSFSGIGGALLALLFTFFINEFGWREAYALSALVMALLVLPFTAFVFRFRPEDKGLKPYGWSEAQEKGPATTHASTGSGAKSGVPATRKAILSVPFICMFLLCGLVSFYASLGTQMNPYGFSLGFFNDDNANRMFGASLVSAVMIGNIGSKVIMGFITDLIGVNKAMLIQLGLVVLGFLGFIFFAQAPWLIYVWGALFGVQNSVYAVSTPLLIRSIFGERDYTKIFTWARIGTGAIGFVGPTMFGLMVDVQGNYTLCFVVGIAIAIVCFICVLAAEATRKKLDWVED
ncbi:MAG: MFS transporter [Coriobacteriales bacterium]|jgi:MFS family permease|nr:MFS transporter [Coriobacteriales bacterium]